MITMLDYAKLSFYVYHSSPRPKTIRAYQVYHQNHFNPKGLPDAFYEVIIDEKEQKKSRAQTADFYASCFVKVENRQAVGVVMAIRGTDLSVGGNDVADIRGWYASLFNSNAELNLPDYLCARSFNFYCKVRRFTKDILGLSSTKIMITGHSLGGALAALLPARAGVLSHAVTFNAPGIAHMPNVFDRWHGIINFRSKYDFISKCGEPIGPVIDVSVPEEEHEAKEVFRIEHERVKGVFDLIRDGAIQAVDCAKSIEAQHSMKNLLKAFIQQNTYCHMPYFALEAKLTAMKKAS